MNQEQNQPQPWTTAEQIDRGRAIVLEHIDRIRGWLVGSPSSVLEERFRHEWNSCCGQARRFRAAEWREAKGAYESELRRFAECVAGGELISKTVRSLLKGKPFDVPPRNEDELPF